MFLLIQYVWTRLTSTLFNTLYTDSYLKKTINSCFCFYTSKIQLDTNLNMFVFANQ